MDFSSNFVGKYTKLRARNDNVGTTEVLLNEFISSTLRWDSVYDADYAVDVTSSSANDTSAGTGARTATVYGLDKDFNFQKEAITLNGQTIVTTTKKYRRVFEIVVDSAGSLNKNDGDLYVVRTGTGGVYTGGVPDTLTGATIKAMAGDNYGLSGLWTAPRGTVYSMVKCYLSSRGKAGTARVQHGYPLENKLVYPRLKIEWNTAAPTLDLTDLPIMTVKGGEDVYFTGIAESAGAIISAEAVFIQQGRP